MVRTQPTVVRTAILNRRVESTRHIPRFNKLLALLVVANIIRNQNFFMTVFGAVLNQINSLIPKNNLRFNFDQTLRTNAVGQGVEQIGTGRHGGKGKEEGGRMKTGVRSQKPEREGKSFWKLGLESKIQNLKSKIQNSKLR